MWSDQARLASAAARGAGGSSVTTQAAATQASFVASAPDPYANRSRRPFGGNGQVVGRNVPAVSGSASFTPAHTEAVAAIARSMV